MARLCERPGCSEPGAAAYGMIPEDLLFWIAPLDDAPVDDHNVLCRRHADAMVVPRGWTLDDRREEIPRLFMPRRPVPAEPPVRASRRRSRSTAATAVVEQLVIDGTDEIPRPADPEPTDPDAAEARVAAEPSRSERTSHAATAPTAGEASQAVGAADGTVTDRSVAEPYAPWQPDFDADDDLDGLLEVQSPLLARAFRGRSRR